MKKAIMLLAMLLVMGTSIGFGDSIVDQMEETIVIKIGEDIAFIDGYAEFINEDNEDLVPIVMDGNTMVPVRFLSYSLGADLSWNSLMKTATIKYNESVMYLTEGSQSVYFDGMEYYSEVAPVITDSNLYVPLRIVLDLMGNGVYYEDGLIIINAGNIIIDPEVQGEIVEYCHDYYKNRNEEDLINLVGVEKSIVKVSNVNSDGETVGFGSGFCVGEDLYLTNYHVVIEADQIILGNEAFGEDISAAIVQYDSVKDLALLRADKTTNLSPLTLGSMNTLKKGETILAIGNPFGLTNAITDGIVSSIIEETNPTLITFTAPIDHGSSGGALLNLYGEVVGITTGGLEENDSFNFAVPINYATQWVRWENNYDLPEYTEGVDDGIEELVDKLVQCRNDGMVADYMSLINYRKADYKDSYEATKFAFDAVDSYTITEFEILRKSEDKAIIKLSQIYSLNSDYLGKVDVAIEEVVYIVKGDKGWLIEGVYTHSVNLVE